MAIVHVASTVKPVYSIGCSFLQEIKLGESEVVLAAGTESMSQAPYAVRNARWGTTLGMDLKVRKYNRPCLIDPLPDF